MKKTMPSNPLATFAAGFIMAILLVGIYSFTIETPASSPAVAGTKISVQDANDMFKRYYQSAPSLNEPFKGFAVSEAEIKMMSVLFKNTRIKACRVYMGKDQNKNDVRVVVGVDKNNADFVSAGVFQVPASYSSPCPSICDNASPITMR